MIRQIHHINFIVRDLDAAIERYRALFGVPINAPEILPQRGVRLARFRLSEIWVVLVQPLDSSGKPAQYLEKHGEGFFLMSCQVDDVRKAAQKASAQGFGVLDNEPRRGLDDWQVMDLDPDDLFGAAIQFVESNE
jgi:methylmalonyl-CoA/ethylmalonyl-CoA epimerase